MLYTADAEWFNVRVITAAGSFKQRFFLLLFFKYIVITDGPIADNAFEIGNWNSAIGKKNWARSSVGLERTPDKREVGSSNLPGPTAFGKMPKEILSSKH